MDVKAKEKVLSHNVSCGALTPILLILIIFVFITLSHVVLGCIKYWLVPHGKGNAGLGPAGLRPQKGLDTGGKIPPLHVLILIYFNKKGGGGDVTAKPALWKPKRKTKKYYCQIQSHYNCSEYVPVPVYRENKVWTRKSDYPRIWHLKKNNTPIKCKKRLNQKLK